MEQTLDPTSFGEFNDNGVWVPIDPLQQSINFGNVGFFLNLNNLAQIKMQVVRVLIQVVMTII